MNIKTNVFGRSVTAVVALALLVGTAAPALLGSKAFAAQVQTRSIKMSDSTPGASGVTYQLSFMNSPTATQELVIEFCTDTPLVGASCDTADPTRLPDLTSATASTGTLTKPASNQLHVKGLTIPGSSTYTLTFTGITNPTYVGTFYARLVTYATANGSDAYTGGSTTGTYTDYGGFALSTVRQIQVTARVMEALTFCVSGIDLSGAANNDCTAATTPNLYIGQGTPQVLDSGRVDHTSAYTQLSTNASQGAIIRMKATNTCANAGLSTSGGSVCNIPGLTTNVAPISANGEVAAPITAGTAAFGMYVAPSTLTTGVTTSQGTITPDANYHNASHTNVGTGDIYYGMDNRNTTEGVRSTYGDPIASTTTPVSRVNNELVFGATVGLTTQAGIYTGNEILIATGTF